MLRVFSDRRIDGFFDQPADRRSVGRRTVDSAGRRITSPARQRGRSFSEAVTCARAVGGRGLGPPAKRLTHPGCAARRATARRSSLECASRAAPPRCGASRPPSRRQWAGRPGCASPCCAADAPRSSRAASPLSDAAPAAASTGNTVMVLLGSDGRSRRCRTWPTMLALSLSSGDHSVRASAGRCLETNGSRQAVRTRRSSDSRRRSCEEPWAAGTLGRRSASSAALTARVRG